MKRIASLLIIGLFIFSACNKSSTSNPENTIVADIDGTTETFNVAVTASALNASGIYSITISGVHADGSSDRVIIAINGPNPISSGTLHFNPPSGQNLAVVSFVQPGGGDGYSPADLGGQDPISVNITSITNTNIQGTFTATLALHGGSNPDRKIVTNGKFNVNYH